MGGAGINPTELIATLINRENNFAEGIRRAWRQSRALARCCCWPKTRSMPPATARPHAGGHRPQAGRLRRHAGDCALANLDYEIERYLGPGETVRITADGVETLTPPRDESQICAFLWVYYGFPASCYEGINVEVVRNRCGAALARADDCQIDLVAASPTPAPDTPSATRTPRALPMGGRL